MHLLETALALNQTHSRFHDMEPSLVLHFPKLQQSPKLQKVFGVLMNEHRVFINQNMTAFQKLNTISYILHAVNRHFVLCLQRNDQLLLEVVALGNDQHIINMQENHAFAKEI